MRVLALRFEAPLMSFGGPLVDNMGTTAPFPGRGLLTGLLANALGYSHGDAGLLQRLQERIRYAVRCDREGTEVVDYQTVDLGEPYMMEGGWTTWGSAEERAGASGESTTIRYRSYLADAVLTVVLALDPPGEHPDLGDLERAVAEPERPLFLGRKCCLPSAALLYEGMEADSLLEALGAVRPSPRAVRTGEVRAWWPEDEGNVGDSGRLVSVHDDRDWENQVCSGRRWLYEGTIRLPEAFRRG